jgi:hypothetical protein
MFRQTAHPSVSPELWLLVPVCISCVSPVFASWLVVCPVHSFTDIVSAQIHASGGPLTASVEKSLLIHARLHHPNIIGFKRVCSLPATSCCDRYMSVDSHLLVLSTQQASWKHVSCRVGKQMEAGCQNNSTHKCKLESNQ